MGFELANYSVTVENKDIGEAAETNTFFKVIIGVFVSVLFLSVFFG